MGYSFKPTLFVPFRRTQKFHHNEARALEGPIIIFFSFFFRLFAKGCIISIHFGSRKKIIMGGAEMVWRGSRRYGLVTYPIFTTVRHIAREYKGILCRGSPVPLCKGTGTKQLKVDYFACATRRVSILVLGRNTVKIIRKKWCVFDFGPNSKTCRNTTCGLGF
jgi:hypothetical protein